MLLYQFSDRELVQTKITLSLEIKGQEKQVCLATRVSKICSSNTLTLKILKCTAVEEIMQSYAFGNYEGFSIGCCLHTQEIIRL